MKKINIILAITVAFFATSCEDYLDTSSKSEMDEKIIFSTPELAETAVLGIAVSFAEEQSYRGRLLPYYGMNTDCEWYNSSDKYPDGKADLAVYGATPSNGQMNTDKNAWAKMYEGIERANICIEGLRNAGEAKPRTPLGHLLAEAITLRAVLYADLVRAWGDVPARFKPITIPTIYIAKSDRDTIYKQIIADLGDAANLAYWPNESEYTRKSNRVNKAFIKALRARICLAAAGYSQRPDSETPRLSNDPELGRAKLYAIAKSELLDLYGNPKGGTLLDSFEQVFRNLCEENLVAGGESMWEIPMSSGRGRMAYTFGIRHQKADQYTGLAQGSQVGPTPNFFYDYDVNDLRRDVTCVPYRWSNNEQAAQELYALNNWSFGKYRFEWMKRRVTSDSDDGLNKQYMRYAEVVLMLAEVTNELDGPAAAAPYLKKLRNRAFDPSLRATKVEAYVDNLTTKQAMFDAIVDEHAFEFAGEMLRKEALIRWNLLGKKMADTRTKMYELREQRDRYSDVPATIYFKHVLNPASPIAADSIPEILVTYGLNRGETLDKSSEFTSKVEWVSPSKLKDEKINAYYVNDPDKYQFWPIWEVFISNSNGKLKNDYGY